MREQCSAIPTKFLWTKWDDIVIPRLVAFFSCGAFFLHPCLIPFGTTLSYQRVWVFSFFFSSIVFKFRNDNVVPNIVAGSVNIHGGFIQFSRKILVKTKGTTLSFLTWFFFFIYLLQKILFKTKGTTLSFLMDFFFIYLLHTKNDFNYLINTK